MMLYFPNYKQQNLLISALQKLEWEVLILLGALTSGNMNRIEKWEYFNETSKKDWQYLDNIV